uniref:Uncharacterized protein n=1 Tax=Schistocephalus solidus TaxID=70667 RepID=A0A0X3PGQ9_SCHSO
MGSTKTTQSRRNPNSSFCLHIYRYSPTYAYATLLRTTSRMAPGSCMKSTLPASPWRVKLIKAGISSFGLQGFIRGGYLVVCDTHRCTASICQTLHPILFPANLT